MESPEPDKRFKFPPSYHTSKYRQHPGHSEARDSSLQNRHNSAQPGVRISRDAHDSCVHASTLSPDCRIPTANEMPLKMHSPDCGAVGDLRCIEKGHWRPCEIHGESGHHGAYTDCVKCEGSGKRAEKDERTRRQKAREEQERLRKEEIERQKREEEEAKRTEKERIREENRKQLIQATLDKKQREKEEREKKHREQEERLKQKKEEKERQQKEEEEQRRRLAELDPEVQARNQKREDRKQRKQAKKQRDREAKAAKESQQPLEGAEEPTTAEATDDKTNSPDESADTSTPLTDDNTTHGRQDPPRFSIKALG